MYINLLLAVLETRSAEYFRDAPYPVRKAIKYYLGISDSSIQHGLDFCKITF